MESNTRKLLTCCHVDHGKIDPDTIVNIQTIQVDFVLAFPQADIETYTLSELYNIVTETTMYGVEILLWPN